MFNHWMIRRSWLIERIYRRSGSHGQRVTHFTKASHRQDVALGVSDRTLIQDKPRERQQFGKLIKPINIPSYRNDDRSLSANRFRYLRPISPDETLSLNISFLNTNGVKYSNNRSISLNFPIFLRIIDSFKNESIISSKYIYLNSLTQILPVDKEYK